MTAADRNTTADALTVEDIRTRTEMPYGDVAVRFSCGCVLRDDTTPLAGWSLCNYHQGYDAARLLRTPEFMDQSMSAHLRTPATPILRHGVFVRQHRGIWESYIDGNYIADHPTEAEAWSALGCDPAPVTPTDSEHTPPNDGDSFSYRLMMEQRVRMAEGDCAEWKGRAEASEAVIAEALAERDAAVARADALAAAIRTHEDLHRPVGPEGESDMDPWTCCDDDRILYDAAAADRGTDR